MYGSDRDPSKLDRYIRATTSGVGSGVRLVAAFVASGVLIVNVIGGIELMFYKVPVIAFIIWFGVGLMLYNAALEDRL